MRSGVVSRVNALVLAAGGGALLFAPDWVLPVLVPDFPAAGLWVGQLVAAAWLGMAALNWLQRSAVLGGIYGRPIVLANLALHFISALVIVKAIQRQNVSTKLWALAVPSTILAIVYAWLLLRGPLEADMKARGSR
jgi:hypothetical protein